MKLQFLEVVQAISLHGSFSEAAAELGCSQSNISYAVAEVEKYLGRRIFARNSRGSKMAGDGAFVVQRIGKILDILSELRQQRKEGLVRIAQAGCAADLVGPVLKGILEHHREVMVKATTLVDSATAMNMLTQGSVDFVLIASDAADNTQFVEHHHWTDEYALIAPMTAADAARPIGAIVEGLPYIQYAQDHLPAPPGAVGSLGIRAKPHAQLDDVRLIVSLVSSGCGYSLVPSSALPSAPPHVAKHALPDTEFVRCRLVGAPRTLLSSPAKLVLQLMKRVDLRS